jgi:hypothetical protein
VEEREFLDVATDAMKERPVWFGLDSDGVASEADVVTAETALAVSFPREYRAFVQRFGGGYFAFTNVFSVDAGSDWSIVDRNSALGLLNRRFIAFSENGCGDYYGFRLADGVCENAVMFFDHDSGEIHSTDYRDLYEYLVAVGLRGGAT